MYTSGVSTVEIARAFGITPDNVRRTACYLGASRGKITPSHGMVARRRPSQPRHDERVRRLVSLLAHASSLMPRHAAPPHGGLRRAVDVAIDLVREGYW